MKKKIIAGLLILCTAFAAIGCGEKNPTGELPGNPVIDNPNTQKPDIPEDAGNTIEINGIKAIAERKVVDGHMQSYLTGEWKNVEVANRRPLAVMIPNNEAALPQYGVSKASVIFEAPMEYYSCTRLMGMFEDYDDLDHIGSVRSSRYYFAYTSLAWDAIYCHWGLAVPLVGPLLNSDRIDNISAPVYGIDNPSDEPFARDPMREAAGYATEYTGIMNIEGYNQAVARNGYRTWYQEGYKPTLLFAADGEKAEYKDAPIARKFSPGGLAEGSDGGAYNTNKAYFEYDEETGLYKRYQFGEPHMDEMNDEQLTCSNVIFMVCWGTYVTEESGYLTFETDRRGDAYFFTNGKVVEGTWSKGVNGDATAADYEPYYFRDKDGNDIVFNQGKTWICLVSRDYEQFITIE